MEYTLKKRITSFKNALKGERKDITAINDVVRCTLLFRGLSEEQINNMSQEEIYLLMEFDSHLQQKEHDRMSKMFGGK